jgi:hypothetical protein
MLSKCANPECSEQFRYLHQGRLFCLTPTPEVQATSYGSLEFLYERFWLCERCLKEMKVVWDGFRAKVELLPVAVPTQIADTERTRNSQQGHVPDDGARYQ